MRVNPQQGVEFANSLIQDDQSLADLNQVTPVVVVVVVVVVVLLFTLSVYTDRRRVRGG